MTTDTRQRLLQQGVAMLLQHGYHDLGIASLLDATGVPKGSFYHHFKSKEDFGLAAIELYMENVHAALDVALNDESRAPLDRVRHFFEMTLEAYAGEGYLGCLLGGLGQELSGVSEAFRKKVEQCICEIADRLARCLDEARDRGELPKRTDTRALSQLIVNGWEGAALRSRLQRNPTPLREMLDFLLAR